MSMDQIETTRTGRDVAAGVAGLLGAAGVGMVFVAAIASIAPQLLMRSPDLSSVEFTWQHGLPPAFLAAMMLVAAMVGRWGWWAAAAGLAVQVILVEAIASTLFLGPAETGMAFAVTGGAVMGGGLAAYGAAGRTVRPWTGAGFAIGLYGGWLLNTGFMITRLDVLGNRNAYVVTLGVPFALCLVAAVGWLVSGTGQERRAGPRRWGVPVWVLSVAAVTIALELALRAVLDGLITSGGLDEVETLHEFGSVAIAQLAAVVLAIVAYRRGGTILSRWVLVGFTAGFASGATGIWQGREADAYWLLGAAGIVGAVGGALIGRVGKGAVPWDALGLAALCIGVVQSSSRDRLGLAAAVGGVQVLMVLAVAFVLAATLALVNTARTARGMSGAVEAALGVGLGFVACFIAALAAFPHTLAAQTGPVNAGPAVTIGSDAIGVFTLYLIGLLVQRARRGIEAEAAREIEAAEGQGMAAHGADREAP